MKVAPALAGPWSVDAGLHSLHVGAGEIKRIGELARALGGCRALLVTDPGLVATGQPQRAQRLLADAGCEVAMFAEVRPNPTTTEVEAGAAAAREHRADLLVALGGGSAMDCAKGINFLTSNGGRVEDYWGFGKASRPMLPSIGIPTTAGTGSEAQSYALISQATGHRKMACGDHRARFRAVVLDPELLATAPVGVAAATGFDAVAHAVESAVSSSANPLSRLLATEAFRQLFSAYLGSLRRPAEPATLAAMQWGAYLAGWAIEASMLGAAHATANPLTARCGVEHGVGVALMLPHVVRFNRKVAEDAYRSLLVSVAREGDADDLASLLERTRTEAGLPARLQECAVPRELLSSLAVDAAEEWTARFNPRPVDVTSLQQLYEAAF